MSAKPSWTYKEVRQVLRESARLECGLSVHGAKLGAHWRSSLALALFPFAEANFVQIRTLRDWVAGDFSSRPFLKNFF